MLSCDMNNMLLPDFIVEDVGVAIKEMGALKAPGYDGLSVFFFNDFGKLLSLIFLSFVSVLLTEKFRWRRLILRKLF